MLVKYRFYDINSDKLSWMSTKMIGIKDINLKIWAGKPQSLEK